MIVALHYGGQTAQLVQLVQGDAGVWDTRAAMQAVVDDALQAPDTRDALERTADAIGRGRGYPRRLYSWCVERVRFKPDPRGVELLRSPDAMLGEIELRGVAMADCDCLAMLGAALLAVEGFRPAFVTGGRVAREQNGEFQHVFFGFFRDPSAEISLENIVPMDPQERVPFGRYPDPNYVRRLAVWGLSPDA